MKLLITFSLLCLSIFANAADRETLKKEGEAATEILQKWQNVEPEKEIRYLHVVYWTPNDREPCADYEARLDRITKHIQAFYGTEMEKLGLGKKSINLQENAAGEVVIHLINGLKSTSKYGKPSGNEIRNECRPVMKKKGINIDDETVLLFCNLASWDAEKLVFSHNSPYYAGGSHVSGTAWQLDSPELDVPNLLLKEPIITDGEYGKISVGKHNSIFIGGIAHELGHALGMPHCKECPDEHAAWGDALMGSGNRSYGDELRGEGKGSFLSMAHGLRLASHPQFSGSVKEMRELVKVDFKFGAHAEGKMLNVSGKVTNAEPPVYAVVAYFDRNGGSDYDALTASAVPDAEGNFSFKSCELPIGKGKLRVFPLFVNGDLKGGMSNTPYKANYEVGKDGAVKVLGD